MIEVQAAEAGDSDGVLLVCGQFKLPDTRSWGLDVDDESLCNVQKFLIVPTST